MIRDSAFNSAVFSHSQHRFHMLGEGRPVLEHDPVAEVLAQERRDRRELRPDRHRADPNRRPDRPGELDRRVAAHLEGMDPEPPLARRVERAYRFALR